MKLNKYIITLSVALCTMLSGCTDWLDTPAQRQAERGTAVLYQGRILLSSERCLQSHVGF